MYGMRITEEHEISKGAPRPEWLSENTEQKQRTSSSSSSSTTFAHNFYVSGNTLNTRGCSFNIYTKYLMTNGISNKMPRSKYNTFVSLHNSFGCSLETTSFFVDESNEWMDGKPQNIVDPNVDNELK